MVIGITDEANHIASLCVYTIYSTPFPTRANVYIQNGYRGGNPQDVEKH